VDLDLPEELPAIRGTQGDLTQLFLNICTNASDAMPGGGRLSIAARPDSAAVNVKIRDTGKGIPPEVLDRILEPFYSTKEDGSGLGLAICRSILWDIGGDMAIQSEEGKGTTIKLTLPVLDRGEKETTG
jgi:two-component system NtrC family sensor kinase